MITVVHVSADYPDPFSPDKTAAVANLIAGAAGFRHIVYSLNRVNGLFGITGFRFAEDRVCVTYQAPPKGLLLRTRLDDVASWILADLASHDVKPDVVHAHKFTIEGLIALRLRESLGCRVICNIQGDTDTQVAELRFDLRSTYRQLAQECSNILSFAPWCAPAVERILGTQLRYEVLPVSTNCDQLITPVMSDRPRLVSLFHLDAWRRKGADALAAAVALVAQDRPDVSLDIYGGGSERQRLALSSAINGCTAPGLVHLAGPLPRERVQQTLNQYSAFVMPSLGETYGMAFVEALFSGTPVVFPRDRAIDGLLPESDIGSGCEPTDVRDLADAINYVLDNEERLKKRLGHAQAAGALDHLRLASITSRYRKILEDSAA
jgi:glycosyltransferase involved in cell wall biosynthesis